MSVKSKDQYRKFLYGIALAGMVLIIWFGLSGSPAVRAQEAATPTPNDYYTVNQVSLSDGTVIEKMIINGPPVPPPGFEIERQAVSLPKADASASINVLTVPAYNWVFGCSAVSGAMIAGYYDRNGWPNMYAGPTNGGVMPLDNSSWGTWTDGSPYTYRNNPLVASMEGEDGRTERGSIDDYWVKYFSTAPDPYITGDWTQHTWGDAIGDYMHTSQSAYGNKDAYSFFYDNWSNPAAPLTCDTIESSQLPPDGTVGRKHFYEARGYTVTDCYNQFTDYGSQGYIPGGFSFAQFKAEIDAGRPVMLNLTGHTIVGVGYDDATNTIYIHDTWDYDTHTMTWGDSYAGMKLVAVSIVNLQPVDTIAPTGSVVIDGGATYTTSTSVNLTLSATDAISGVAQMSFSNNGSSWSAWESYATNKSWTLSSGDGSKTVYAQYKDNAGNISSTPATDTITFDTVAPAGSVVIDGGATFAASTSVKLTLSATDTTSGVAQISFSNDWSTWSAWESYATNKSWTLSSGDGSKTVYVRYQDNAGNISTPATDTITLDTVAPAGSVVIDGSATYAASTGVNLTLSATDATSGIAQMSFSNNGSTWSAWKSYATSKAWTLSSGDGNKTVYAKYKDNAGNISDAGTDTITLDTVAPAGSVVIDGGATFAASTSVNLTLSATDDTSGVAQMRFGDNNINWSYWESFATSKVWTLSSGNGIKTVYARFRDLAGNESSSASNTIVLPWSVFFPLILK
ncbi:MAG: C39 family peptidase [Chloroflexi bacterium]|nr:C39 family peptidase [Chloroflexota bacterium]